GRPPRISGVSLYRPCFFEFPVSSFRFRVALFLKLETRNLKLSPASSMTRTTTGNVLHRTNAIRMLDGIAQRDLVGVADAVKRDRPVRTRLLILHVEHLIARPQELLRGAMAAQAPLHLQRMGREGQRHLVDLAVAAETADTLVHVDAVVEVNEVGQVVDARPD